jgi:predicted nucleotidyltransferase
LIIPEFIQLEVNRLSKLHEVKSIWLMGSRANGMATDDSDWDLLVFQNKPVGFIESNHSMIDIVRVNNKEIGQTDGINYNFPFSSWDWEELSKDEAKYTGRKFVEYENKARDNADPVYIESNCSAYCLWSEST